MMELKTQVAPGQLRLMNDSRTFLTLGIDPDFSSDPTFWLCLMSNGTVQMFSETAICLYTSVLE